MSDEEIEEAPYKLGEVINEGGIETVVVAVSSKRGPIGWGYRTSAEPLAAKKGYLTRNQEVGFRIQHHSPPVPLRGGVHRDPAKLSAVDWDFTPLMKEPLEVRKLALVHELARECAAMRETCRVYDAGLETAKEWAEKEAAVFAGLEPTNILVQSGNGEERQRWIQADEFLQLFLMRLPFGARGLQTDAITEDRPWLEIPEGVRRDLVEKVNEIEKERQAKRKSKRGLRYSDKEADGPRWPFDDPIEFAREWDEKSGLPRFSFNGGRPGRMILAERHDNAHLLPILSETLNVCVCLNFSDEEIMAKFADWLKWRRANLHDDLAAFRAAGGSALRMQKGRVDAGFKALAALRLRAKLSGMEAALDFRTIYPAAEKRTRKAAGDAAPMAQVANLAKDAVELGAEFLPECELDSAVKRIHL